MTSSVDMKIKEEPSVTYEYKSTHHELSDHWQVMSATLYSLHSIKVEIDSYKIEIPGQDVQTGSIDSDQSSAITTATAETSKGCAEKFVKLELAEHDYDIDINHIRDKFIDIESCLGSISRLVTSRCEEFRIVDDRYQISSSENSELPTRTSSHSSRSEKTFSCNICGSEYSSTSNLRKHAKVHNVNGVFRCPHDSCQREYTTKWGLVYHSWTHTGQKPYKCERCSLRFTRKMALQLHVAKIHEKTASNEALLKTIRCAICRKEFSNRQNYIVHSRIHNNERPFKCGVCSRCFRDQSNYNHHRKLHEHQYECRRCQLCYPTLSELDNHACDPNAEKKYVCRRCSASFAGYRAFNRHCVGHRHNGDLGKIECDRCDKIFNTKKGYKQHYRLHTGELPYKCEICDIGFRSASYRLRHMQKVHLGSPARSRSRVCQYCGKGFSDDYDLSQHMSLHTGEKPYRCRQCGESFKRKRELREHRCA